MDSEGQMRTSDTSQEMYAETTSEPLSTRLGHVLQTKVELEDVSEKDDSTDDEDCSKNKSVYYPQEILDNPKIKKYWKKRYSIFSKFDEGIKMDVESWYSVTPEKIAAHIAERCQSDIAVEAFCGAGGNAIQLAFTCQRVIAIDIDPHKIKLARHNAQVYGVADRIEFIVGDFLQLAPSLIGDVVFMSPPWGGPSYIDQSLYSLSSLLPVPGPQLFNITSAITNNIVCFLPKNVDIQELAECAWDGGSVEVVQYILDQELIAVAAYFRKLVNAAVE